VGLYTTGEVAHVPHGSAQGKLKEIFYRNSRIGLQEKLWEKITKNSTSSVVPGPSGESLAGTGAANQGET